MTTGHPYLRRRVRPRPPTVPGPAATGSPAVSGPPVSTTSRPSGASPATTVTPPSGARQTATPSGPSVGTGSGGGLSLSFGGPGTADRTPAASPHPATPASRPAAAASPAGGASSRGTAASAPSDRVARRLAARAARIRPFPAPDPQDVRVLGPDHPVVRIDRRRSAVGALRVTGATSAAWETTDWTVGAETVDGAEAGRAFRTTGNRPLVGFDDGAVLVSLRHVRQLRRALVMGRGTERLVVALHDGTTLAVDPGDADTTTLLALSVVDGELELRAEPFPRSSHDGDVFAAFGFVLSAPTGGV